MIVGFYMYFFIVYKVIGNVNLYLDDVIKEYRINVLCLMGK